MLKKIEIKNIALIDYVEIIFFDGLNVLTGETGSGKSIIIDSLSFVFGARPDKTLIKSGEERCEVSAVFCNIPNNVFLEIDVIEKASEIELYRSFDINGKSEIKINGVKVTASILKMVASLLIDIHGQNEHHKLLNEKYQLEIIDVYAKDTRISSIKNELATICSEISKTKDRIKSIGGTAEERERAADFLAFQVKEIEGLNIKEGEFEKLKERQHILNNKVKISAALLESSVLLSGENGDGNCVNSLLSKVASLLGGISNYGENYTKLYERVNSLLIDSEDFTSELESFISTDMVEDETDSEVINERIDRLKNAFKKYGKDEVEVLEFLSDAKQKLTDLNDSEQLLHKLNEKFSKLNEQGLQICLKLSDIRKAAAEKFSQHVIEELTSLGMKNCRFEVYFDEEEEKKYFTKNGFDDVMFLFSANMGENVKPLSKIISGGEMSRLSLAIKTITAYNDGTPSMIFDEIDAGISGQMGQVVAEKMAIVSVNKQVIAVSHLPQIAAMADTVFQIEKSVLNGKTKTSVQMLDKIGSANEVARLVGGSMASTHALNHANELIESGKMFKNKIRLSIK